LALFAGAKIAQKLL